MNRKEKIEIKLLTLVHDRSGATCSRLNEHFIVPHWQRRLGDGMVRLWEAKVKIRGNKMKEIRLTANVNAGIIERDELWAEAREGWLTRCKSFAKNGRLGAHLGQRSSSDNYRENWTIAGRLMCTRVK